MTPKDVLNRLKLIEKGLGVETPKKLVRDTSKDLVMSKKLDVLNKSFDTIKEKKEVLSKLEKEQIDFIQDYENLKESINIFKKTIPTDKFIPIIPIVTMNI